MEAVEVVGFLAEIGIEAIAEGAGSAGWVGAGDFGSQRILVHEHDLERARQALEEAK